MSSRIRQTLTRHPARRILTIVAALSSLLAALTVYSQRFDRSEGERGYRGRGGYRYFRDEPPGAIPKRDIFPGNVFTFCRVRYNSSPYRRGGGWQTDYDASDINFSTRLAELTTIRVNRDKQGRVKHAVIRLTDDDLFNYPFIYIVEPGALAFSDKEVERLRSYLMPSDIVGSEILEEDRGSGRREFKFVPGPVFTNVLLADEINRTPPKTQSALREAMEEKQVTVAGERRALARPFFVLATCWAQRPARC